MIFRRALSILISAVLIAVMPLAAFADETQDSLEELELATPQADYLAEDFEASDDDLLMQFIDKQVASQPSGGKTMLRARKTNRRSTLSENSKMVYDFLAAEITEASLGNREEAIFSLPLDTYLGSYIRATGKEKYPWKLVAADFGLTGFYTSDRRMTGEAKYKLFDEQGIDVAAILNALILDMPYNLYWYDKTIGMAFPLNSTAFLGEGAREIYFSEQPCVSFEFIVSRDYSADGTRGTYALDTAKTSSASECADTVASIVSQYANLDDLAKLTAYKDRICALTDYDYSASTTDPYGDIWQLIYVFDDKPETKVVCEGYSKAFQYLCDKSDFQSDLVECHRITGEVTFPRSGGGHMWNIVHMDDGRNYLCDITNSDSGTVGAPDKLFLKGATSGSVNTGYSFRYSGSNSAHYDYDADATDMYSREELTLSGVNYGVSDTIWDDSTIEYNWSSDMSTVTATCKSMDGTLTNSETADAVSEITTPATCTTNGIQTFKADFYTYDGFGHVEHSVDIPATGHSWTSAVTAQPTEYAAGTLTYTCMRCGLAQHTSIDQTAIVDLPAVKISKPKAGQKYLTAKWKKVSKKNQKIINKIQIQYSLSSDFSSADTAIKTVKKTKTSLKIKKLKSKKYYYVRVRSYKVEGGIVHVSNWSKAKKIKIK
ncbi:MAG: hypothetical protein IKE85_10060 [Mogibacterium sp.]|nr:hypothetical protein [Mogibacterium sp.]